ncbi:MAG TPA: TadE family protein [Terriglobia bacterium]|nr:TadE family protein [Terriglobia bacterium]
MKTMLNRLRRTPRRWQARADEGQSQIEFILSILTIMFTIFWTWEVVLAVYTYNVLSDAAKEGVRYAIVHGSNNCYPSGGATAQSSCGSVTAPTLCNGRSPNPAPDNSTSCTGANLSACNNVAWTVGCYAQLSLHDISGMTITTNWPDASLNTAGSKVNIVVSYKYVPFLALPITPTLTTASQGRVVN